MDGTRRSLSPAQPDAVPDGDRRPLDRRVAVQGSGAVQGSTGRSDATPAGDLCGTPWGCARQVEHALGPSAFRQDCKMSVGPAP
jgi:hypothetical protein